MGGFPRQHIESVKMAPANTGAKKQKKWSKGKVKDKAQHAVILDKATSDKLYKDVQSYRLITVATLVDRLKINGSLARDVWRIWRRRDRSRRLSDTASCRSTLVRSLLRNRGLLFSVSPMSWPTTLLSITNRTWARANGNGLGI